MNPVEKLRVGSGLDEIFAKGSGVAAVLESVEHNASLARRGARAGGVAGVRAVSRELRGSQDGRL
jgi:hypothetical protein